MTTKNIEGQEVISAKPWWVYLLLCKGNVIYTGITTCVEARYKAHASGKGARFTKSHKPIRILGTIQCVDRSAASRAEYQIKQLPRSEKLALCGGA